VFGTWMRSSVRQVVHDQVLADNVQTAKQMTMLIRHMDVADLRENRHSWLKLQNTVRDIRLPNEGFVCVIDAGDGSLLCHPALKQAPSILLKEPGMEKPTMQKPAMRKPGMEKLAMQKPIMQKPAMKKPAMQKAAGQFAGRSGGERAPNETQEIQGYTTEHHGELQIIAAGYIPELDATVNVHQLASGIEKSITRLMKPVIPLGLVISLGLVLVTTGLVVAVLRRYDNRLATINENLEDRVDQRTRSLRKTRDAVIFGLAKLAESRDTDTGEHLDRIRIYVTILAKHLSQKFDWIDDKYIDNLALASSLHDIGKVGIPDQILLKPGCFTPDEREIMETHAQQGGDCLVAISQHLGEDDFLQLSREITFFHHEKWDGTGYPFQTAGDKIPLSGRIVALADVYDALRSRRPYKEPMPHEKAKRILLEGEGSHFDPMIVEAFLACEEEFLEVAEKYQAKPPGVPSAPAIEAQSVLVHA